MSWDYKKSNEWEENYKECNGKKQSPINIDTSTFTDHKNECNDCKLYINYKPSDCHINVVNRTPTVYFNSDSYILYNGYKGEKGYEFLENKFILKKMTIHTPSMHKINDQNYDIEVNLYHQSLGESIKTKVDNKINQTNEEIKSKGIVISMLFRKGDDNGIPNRFFSQFINQIPYEEEKSEKEITVDADWGPKQLLPKNKAFFTYPGSLPHPPCNEEWYWIVFEEVGIISKTLYETFKMGFNRNVRTVQNTNNRNISYNPSPKFNKENELYLKEIEEKMKKLGTEKKKIKEEMNKNKDQTDKLVDILFSKNKKEDEDDNSSIRKGSSYSRNKKLIKFFMLFVIFILVLYGSLNIAKYLILSGTIPNFLTKNRIEMFDTNNNDNNENNENNENNKNK